MPAVQGLVPNFISYPIHSNAISKMTERGGNALGIEPREDSLLRKCDSFLHERNGDNPLTHHPSRRPQSS